MAKAAFLVTNVLLPVPLDDGGMLLSVTPPVVGMSGAPFLRAVQTDLSILRVGRDLLAMVVGATPTLAIRIAAHRLPRLILRWMEDLFAVAATSFDYYRVVAPGRG
jgi:hypothetical protein